MAKQTKKTTLTAFLKEMLDKRWSQFVRMEADPTGYTSNQAVVFSLIRACAKGKLPAIKESLDRIDGRVAIEIEVEYPKFFFLYPNAKSVEAGAAPPHDDAKELAPGPDPAPTPDEPMATGSLRATLERMSEEPRSLVKIIIEAAILVESMLASGKDTYDASDPLVKSVMIAGLLNMAHNGNLGAMFEVLEQIDGKVADKIKVLGEDIYINVYTAVAPAGAVKNDDGIYQLVADNTTSAWAASLERQRKKGDGYDSRISR